MSGKPAIKRAMEAHTDLYVFDLIHNITETHLRGDHRSQEAGRKIREICKRQCSRLLHVMDDASAEANRKEQP